MKQIKKQSNNKKNIMDKPDAIDRTANSSEKKISVDPKEHEEDLSTNIRMKSQPLDKKKKS